MAWYLSEIVTDLSPIREILRLYDQTDSFTEGRVQEEYKGRLVALLRQATFNTDHIETDTIPPAYENDEYKWLAAGYHELIRDLGLITFNVEESSRRYSIDLTELGEQVMNQAVSIPDLMRLKLPEWGNSLGVKPYPEIIKIASKLKQLELYPCGGLLLLEVLIVLLRLESREDFVDYFDSIYQRRKAFYTHMVGEPRIDLVQYSDFLWEQLSEDLSNYYAANYPARATLQLMMYAGELSYGPVPPEIFGLVQYVTIAE